MLPRSHEVYRDFTTGFNTTGILLPEEYKNVDFFFFFLISLCGHHTAMIYIESSVVEEAT